MMIIIISNCVILRRAHRRNRTFLFFFKFRYRGFPRADRVVKSY